MSKLTDDDILYVAKLSKLSLSADQIKTFKADLEQILNFVDKLQEVDTSNVDPTAQVSGLTNVVREDEINPELISKEQLLKNVPVLDDDNHIVVKKVL